MKTIDRNGKIAVLGATFKGINDVIKHAVSSKAKNGVYVGEDSMAYPCFDDEDYANENRRFGISCLPTTRKTCSNGWQR